MQTTPASQSSDSRARIAILIFAIAGAAMIVLGLKGLWELQAYRVYGLALFQVWFVAGAVISGGAVLLTIAWSLRGTTPGG